ncbi:hypothetical protein QBC33DRAFT_602390 [Phialemonium atrogriseum]|uniref:Major facilitator superfamily (MFS) profile domain-containing protein n=1 Tax=Phialemonium atrogriseum TaxID=1093897 RepID=A0AAJ0FCC9_9PEZI|nr:uncharacterized protein QBC33DRAFT_602390 [Phialemonium atrogriseum]KAK1761997.1 hypothetical protein QBC33DRAFT_602390 [Phialemonium atrogriseum]
MSNPQPVFRSPPFPTSAGRQQSRWAANVELAERPLSVTGPDRLHAQVRRRQNNDRAIIENPLAHLTDEDLVADVRHFSQACLPDVDTERILRAARVAKDIRTYDEVARSTVPDAGRDLPVQLTANEKRALKAERDSLLEGGMLIVILTVSLAAFLQGHVQSSINGASLYAHVFGLPDGGGSDSGSDTALDVSAFDEWKLGAANASPFLFAAALGCPLALPINDLFGRRGAMAIAAVLIFSSSLGVVFVHHWYELFGVRVINGVGMGIKAVSTPILAGETSLGFWRGTSILAWQLWVAFGMMIGFVFNLIFTSAKSDSTTVRLILGAPMVPSLMLLAGLYFCPESPRYYMRPRSLNYNPAKAYKILRRLRKTELQALRDVYLVYKSIEQEYYLGADDLDHPERLASQSVLYRLAGYLRQYKQLFRVRRLRNALISSATVNLAQQLCGINILAFYSGTVFLYGGATTTKAMEFSFGFGAINFFFCLPAIRTIDTLGRRKWLTITLPFMAVFLAAAALSFRITDKGVRTGIVAMWLFLFAAAYSPGPIPFTLASESFPLSHRESGCAFAIAVNLFFAGLLSICFPTIISHLHNGGTLALFSGLNLVALALVFALVEETKRRSLEDLDLVFAVPKRAHVRYQLGTYLPWFARRYLLGRRGEEKPSLYVDMIWGSTGGGGGAGEGGGDDKGLGTAAGRREDEGVFGDGFVGGGRGDSDAESVDTLHA